MSKNSRFILRIYDFLICRTKTERLVWRRQRATSHSSNGAIWLISDRPLSEMNLAIMSLKLKKLRIRDAVGC